jgi:tRNA threonylcarbamoyl adenosine modification protein (Sua5/YciO/YrdC/YwlC family)
MEILFVDQYHPSKYQFDQVVNSLNQGQLVVLPTDTYYCLCALSNQTDAIKWLTHFQGLIGKDEDRPLTILCDSIAQASELTQVDNMVYRILNAVVPAAVTFLLHGQPRTLKRLKLKAREQVGLRIPKHALVRQFIEFCEMPLLCLPVENLEDDEEKQALVKQYASLWLQTHYHCQNQPSSVVDLTDLPAKLLRHGQDFDKIAPFLDE